MGITEAMRSRHSVRAYWEKPIEPKLKDELNALIAACNKDAKLHIQLITGEKAAFSGFRARYGKFSGVTNYIALVGKNTPDFEERCGYYGQKIVLRAQELKLNTCWVAATYNRIKTVYKIEPGERLCCVIAIGYGKTNGIRHLSKPPWAVMRAPEHPPEWFLTGVEAALLAPTALNHQKFLFILNDDGTVCAKAAVGFLTQIDIGIVKLHFEMGAGKENFEWGADSD